MFAMIHVSPEISLRVVEASDAEAMFSAIERNRANLRAWMPWVDDTRSEDDVLAFIARVTGEREDAYRRPHAILFEGSLVGVIGFPRGDKVNMIVEIGYWLSTDMQGNGIMTACCRAMIAVAFGECEANRVEICVATENHKSRAIPERLGFRLEGIKREAGYLYGRYVDNALYSLLKREYEPLGCGARRD
jgi:ribosomal-protein-serine acetyltransferase